MAATGKYSMNPMKLQDNHETFMDTSSNANTTGITLIEHILKGICDRDQENQLFERYLKLKALYFNQTSKDLLGDFLCVKHYGDKSVDEILTCHYKQNNKKEFIHIIKLFIAGEFDAVHTARMLERYYKRHKPSILRLLAIQRYNKLKIFIDLFKTNCMKDILHEKVGFHEPIDAIGTDIELQHQSLFAQRITMASTNQHDTALSSQQRQQRSLFKGTHSLIS